MGASTTQQLPFPVPQGWTVVTGGAQAAADGDPPGNPPAGANQTVRLQDGSGACRMVFSRTFSQLSLAAWQDALVSSFAKGKVDAEPQGPMSLGGAPTAHLLLRYPGGVLEQVYALRSGDELLTLVTVHAAHCASSFQPTLDAFRL